MAAGFVRSGKTIRKDPDQRVQGAIEEVFWTFRAARRAHAAVESAINNLQQPGLGRVLARGPAGFERMVALSVLALNVHRIGLLLQRAERKRLRRMRGKRPQRAAQRPGP